MTHLEFIEFGEESLHSMLLLIIEVLLDLIIGQLDTRVKL